MAALLSTSANAAEDAYCIRMTQTDLASVGVSPKKTKGDTKINEVDLLHRDLFGNPSIFENLVQLVLSRQVRGSDGLRVVYKKQIHRLWINILESSEISSETIRNKLRKKIAQEEKRSFQ